MNESQSELPTKDQRYPYRLSDGSVLTSYQEVLKWYAQNPSPVSLNYLRQQDQDLEDQYVSPPLPCTTPTFEYNAVEDCIEYPRNAASTTAASSVRSRDSSLSRADPRPLLRMTSLAAAQAPTAVLLPPSPALSVYKIDDDGHHSASYKSYPDYIQTKNQKFVQKHKRCLIIFLVLFLLSTVGLVICIVMFKQVAQMFMNGATLQFASIKITQPTVQGFAAAIKGEIKNAGPVNAKTQPMNITIYYYGMALGWMQMPAIQLNFGKADMDMAAGFNILNETAFIEFSKDMITKQSFEWRLVGTTNLRVMDQIDVNELIFDKTVTINGMSNFPNVEVSKFDLQGNWNAMKTQITTSLNNKSPISIEMGTMLLDMYYRNGYVGRVNTSLPALNMGDNPMQLNGYLAPVAEGKSTQHFSEMFSNYVSGKDSDVVCVVYNVIGQNGTSVPWLIEALRAVKIPARLPPGQNLEMISSIQLAGMDIDFSTSDYNNPLISASNVSVGFEMPFDFPVQVQKTRQSVTIYDGNVAIASIKTDYVDSSNLLNASIIQTTIANGTKLVVGESQTKAFAKYLDELFVSEEKSYRFEGTADMVALTPLGLLQIEGAPMNVMTTSKGMQGLKPYRQDLSRVANPVILNTTVNKGLPDQILMSNGIILYSVSDVKVHLGDVTLNLLVSGVKIGYTILRDLIVAPGDNEIVVESYFQPVGAESETVGHGMLENFLNGKPTFTTMQGTIDNSTQNPLVQLSLSHLELTAPFNGLREKLVKSSSLKVNGFTVPFKKKAHTQFNTMNPFGDQFVIEAMNGTIYKDNETMATMNVVLDGHDEDHQPVVVPAQSALTTQLFEIEMLKPLGGTSIKSLFKGIVRKLDVSVVTFIQARLGNYSMYINYNDTKLPANVELVL